MKKIALIVIYFGKMNNYFDLWLSSCAMNKSITWLFFTDCKSQIEYPENVHVNYIKFHEIKSLFQQYFDFEIALNYPYKLCDFRPAYGIVFNEFLKSYDFWGFCDMDLIFGDIRNFLTEDILARYAKILKTGHFTLIKNEEQYNQLFMTEITGVTNYKTAFQSEKMYGFDEWNGLTPIALKSNISEYFDTIYADLNISCGFIHLLCLDNGYTPQVFVWENGRLYRHYHHEGQVHEQEFMYIHLQKRKMKMNINRISQADKYYIGPFEFFCDDDFVAEYDSLVKINKFHLFYPAWLRLEFKWKIDKLLKR
ncbi:MAG: hypothetical protein FWG91_11655 [Lachnospiraceae bacterium]|nr:hypothetical protein [Lachnospiraceae bacterium]